METNKLCVNCFDNSKNGEFCENCGYTDGDLAKNQLHLPPGTVLKGQYILGKVLGYGGFGVTYLAYDLNLQTVRAIKEYLPGELSTRSSDGLTIHSYSGEAAENYQYGLGKFVEEGRMLARYSDVTTIVSVYDFFNENNTAYLVMEYLDGENISEYVKRNNGRLSVDETLRIMEPVFDALTAIHKTGMIHRDISPDNIFVTRTGTTKLLDFGTARFAMGEKSKSLSVILKPGYAPPEQYYSRGKQGPWTDIYALAATIYRLIVGNNPPDSIERQNEEITDLSNDFSKDIPNNIKNALAKGLSLKYSERQKSVDEFKQQLYTEQENFNNEKLDETEKLKKEVNIFKDIKPKNNKEEKKKSKEIIIPNTKNIKRKRKIFAIISTAVIISSIFIVILITLIIPNINYNKAINLRKESQYDKAITIFAELEDFKDSKVQITEINYMKALSYQEVGKLDDAIDIYSELVRLDYKDSKEKIYEIALELQQMEKFNEAIIVFNQLKDYKDAKEKIYQIALNFLEYEEYNKAIQGFSELKNYSDSSNLAILSKVMMHIEEKQYQKGINLLDTIDNTKKSEKIEEIINECRYLMGKAYYNNDDIENAYEQLRRIQGYKDTDDIIQRIKTDKNNQFDTYLSNIKLSPVDDYEKYPSILLKLKELKDEASKYNISIYNINAKYKEIVKNYEISYYNNYLSKKNYINEEYVRDSYMYNSQWIKIITKGSLHHKFVKAKWYKLNLNQSNMQFKQYAAYRGTYYEEWESIGDEKIYWSYFRCNGFSILDFPGLYAVEVILRGTDKVISRQYFLVD